MKESALNETHSCSYRVCYADTDCMGRVYYANYFVIAERARTEFLRDIGHAYKAFEESGLYFPVRSCQARYYNFAVYDDLLTCRSYIDKLRHATISFTTEMYRGDEAKPLVSASVELACVASTGKPHTIPDAMREAFLPYVRTINN